ncbi:histidine kinase [Mucilaginibacter sp.]|uniref:sensor histidine kinase n=1 Tax=Mucilaginibacter sp. TaxID=1882438 RepID=UPI0025DDBDF9|nr:histidine kinase [Mucilaginibacter sp.]
MELQERALIIHFGFIICQVTTFYYTYLLILPLIAQNGKKYLLTAGLLSAPCIFIVLRFLIEEILDPYFFNIHNYFKGTATSYYILDNLYRGIPTISFSIALWSLQRIYRQEHENRLLRDENKKAELAFLKSQINPHFLYNTLNYIYSLAYPVSAGITGAVLKLSHLMRYMLDDSSNARVPLQKEVDYLNNYIAIYKLRFETIFFVDFDIHLSREPVLIAPLLLIPFVENALKHGVVDDPDTPIVISLHIQMDELNFMVNNKINTNRKDTSSGIGLANVNRRLELIYPKQYKLLISEKDGFYSSKLLIKLN